MTGITILPIIHHTYILPNKPTGKNNLGLNKDLFQDISNYEKFPLKYFVYKDYPIFK